MEANEFDRILKGKVEEARPHQDEMRNAQPYLWTAVQQELQQPKDYKRWLYLAAACIILLLGVGSVMLYSLQNSHQYEMQQLQAKLDKIDANQQTQEPPTNNENVQLANLQAKVDSLNYALQNVNNLPVKEVITPQIVRVVDTVYLKQIETIVERIPIESTKPSMPESEETMAVMSEANQDNNADDGIIYPSNREGGERKKSTSGSGLKFPKISL